MVFDLENECNNLTDLGDNNHPREADDFGRNMYASDGYGMPSDYRIVRFQQIIFAKVMNINVKCVTGAIL